MTDNSPATGRYTSNGMPHGSTSLTPHVVVTPAEKAIEFYRDVFGARVVDVTRFPGNDLVSHAVLDFGACMLTLSDPMESYGLVAGDPVNGVTYSLALYVPNTDEVTAAAAAHGAVIREAGDHVRFRRPVRFRPRPVRAALVDHDPRRGHLPRGVRQADRRLGGIPAGLAALSGPMVGDAEQGADDLPDPARVGFCAIGSEKQMVHGTNQGEGDRVGVDGRR